MRGHILRKIRKFRILSALVVSLLTIVSFQNCAPQYAVCEEPDCEGSTESASTSNNSASGSNSSIWTSRPGSQTIMSGGSPGSVNVGGGTSSGSNGGGGVVVGGGGSSGSSGGSVNIGAGGGSSGGGSSDAPLRITKQPEGVSVQENGDFQLDVTVNGGTAPYTFQWYHNSKAITGGLGNYSFFSDNADSWSKEGTYYIIIKDGRGQSVQSNMVRVTIVEPAVGCSPGKYFTYTNQTYDQGYDYFTKYFDGPRGKFLLHQSYDTYNMLFPYPSYSKLTHFNVPSNLKYLEKTWINCRSTIPRIHTPAVNPSYENYFDRFSDNEFYRYDGTVSFECRNNKLKFISNTCKWTKISPY